MVRQSKRMKEVAKLIDHNKVYSLLEAVELAKQCPQIKFDQTVGISLVLGVDTRKADQQVRGTVSLPKGTGRRATVVVLTKGDKIEQALEAGADFAGFDDLVDRIAKGWTDFDALIATPDMMREVGKLGKVLGPRGLMPTPKAGTVTTDVATAVREIKAGKVEFRADKFGQVNLGIAKLSFDADAISENAKALINAVLRSRPAAAKGQFLQQVVLSTTMGPGLRVHVREFTGAV